MRSILGFLHPLDRAAHVHGPNPALRRAARRIPLGATVSDRLARRPGHIQFRRRPAGSQSHFPADVVQTLEHRGLARAELELSGSHLGGLRSIYRHDDVIWPELALRGRLRWQSDEPHCPCAAIRRHVVRHHEFVGQRLWIPRALCHWTDRRRPR